MTLGDNPEAGKLALGGNTRAKVGGFSQARIGGAAQILRSGVSSVVFSSGTSTHSAGVPEQNIPRAMAR